MKNDKKTRVHEDTRAIIPLENSALSETEAAQALATRSPEELAAVIMKAMDLMAAGLKLETPHRSTATRVRGARTVPREFVASMIAAAERSPEGSVLRRFDSERARGVMESADAYRAVAERTAMFLASVNYTIEARWAEVVANAMQTFALAGIVAESPKQAKLAAEVENLSRQLGRKGRRPKKKEEKTAESEK